MVEEGLEVVKAWVLRQGAIEVDDLLGVDHPFCFDEATRAYLAATIDRIEATRATRADFPTRPGVRCATCEHRGQCPA